MAGYYKVTVIRGHQGCGVNDGTITFYYHTENLMKAINLAKKQPGVKHTRMPVCAMACSREEYELQRKVSAYKRAGL